MKKYNNNSDNITKPETVATPTKQQQQQKKQYKLRSNVQKSLSKYNPSINRTNEIK